MTVALQIVVAALLLLALGSLVGRILREQREAEEERMLLAQLEELDDEWLYQNLYKDAELEK